MAHSVGDGKFSMQTSMKSSESLTLLPREDRAELRYTHPAGLVTPPPERAHSLFTVWYDLSEIKAGRLEAFPKQRRGGRLSGVRQTGCVIHLRAASSAQLRHNSKVAGVKRSEEQVRRFGNTWGFHSHCRQDCSGLSAAVRGKQFKVQSVKFAFIHRSSHWRNTRLAEFSRGIFVS